MTIDRDPCRTEDGLFTVLAVDHPPAMFGSPGQPVPVPEVGKIKAELLELIAPQASGVLVDPVLGLEAFTSAAVSPRPGLMLCLEDDEYQRAADAHRVVAFRDGWGVQQAVDAGADAVKLLWRYRDDVAEAADHRRFAAAVGAEADRLGVGFVLEPIWVPLPGEDLAEQAVQDQRAESIVSYALLAAELGATVVKSEFPGAVSDEPAQEAAAERCAAISRELDVPWVLLSAGVGYDDFVVQTRLATAAGARGFIGGRAIWGPAATADGAARRDALAVVAERWTHLVDTVREAASTDVAS